MSNFYSSTESYRKRVREAVKSQATPFQREPSMSDVFEAVITRTCNDIKLPCFSNSCVNSNDVQKVQDLNSLENEIRLRGLKISKALNQLEMGLFFKGMNDALVKSRPVFELYSAHDTSIHGLLALLDAEDLRFAPYASSLIVELWKTAQSRKLVRFIHNGDMLKTKWVDFKDGCDLEMYLEYAQKQIPKDFIEACKKA